MSIDVKEGDKLKCPNCDSPGKDSSFFITKHPSGDLLFTCADCKEAFLYEPPITSEMVIRFVKKNYPAAVGFVTALLGGGKSE